MNMFFQDTDSKKFNCFLRQCNGFLEKPPLKGGVGGGGRWGGEVAYIWPDAIYVYMSSTERSKKD